MGKKGAHSGLSPKDRSTNAMDKFIQRNDRKRHTEERLPGRRKDKNIPIDLWPIEDQIAYYENRTDEDRFRDKYSSYSTWYDEVKRLSKVYPSTFMSFVAPYRDDMRTWFDSCMLPKEAVQRLRKLGVY